jgi:nickel-dependent lactate racemase
MRVKIDYGLEHVDVDVPESRLVALHRQPPAPPLPDPIATIREALEKPIGFPPLRRALTPDDHVAIVVDEHLPHLPELLVAVLEHLAEARIDPNAITVLCAPGAAPREWEDHLPAAFGRVHFEVHDPTDRQHLSYLATTRRGRRIYLNRTAVDAEQLIVLARRTFDPLLGYAGSEGAIYPALSDEATRQDMFGLLSVAAPGDKPWPARKEATEVAWLLGAPFMVQVIEGSNGDVAHIVCGLGETGDEGLRLLNARWRISAGTLADTVVASVGGNADRHTFADLANALACAARVVKADGRIVLLCQAEPSLGAGAELLRKAEDPEQALRFLREQTPPDMAAAFLWARAAQRASIYLLSAIPLEIAEDLFTTPLEHAGQVQRLLSTTQSCLFLSDAHKTMAVAPSGSRE